MAVGSQPSKRGMRQFERLSDWVGALFLGVPHARALKFSDDVTKIEYTSGVYVAPSSLLQADGPVVPAMKRTAIVDVQLPAHVILTRSLDVPRAAKTKMHEVALLDLMRKTPFSPQEIYMASAAGKLRDDMIPVRQWLFKRADADSLIKRLEAPGIQVRKLLVGEADGAVLLDRRRILSKRTRWLRLLNASMAVSAFIAATTWWLLPASKAAQALPQLSEAHAGKQQLVFALRQELEARSSTATADESFVREVVMRTRLVDLLRNLTVALPDSVWISDVSLRSDTLLITGETQASATDLVLSLAEKSGFDNPRLNGPVSRTRTGAEKFQLAIGFPRAR